MYSQEKYEKMAMILFYPFRELQELKFEDTDKYWEKYQQIQQQGKLYKDAINVLQNIQDKNQLQKLKRV